MRDRCGLRNKHHRGRSSTNQGVAPMAKSSTLPGAPATNHNIPAIHAIYRPRNELRAEATCRHCPVTDNVARTRARAMATGEVRPRRAAGSISRLPVRCLGGGSLRELPPCFGRSRRLSFSVRSLAGRGVDSCAQGGLGWEHSRFSRPLVFTPNPGRNGFPNSPRLYPYPVLAS